ncbi:MAG: NUDIX hydrolase [Spirochaetia bacterium]|nr:NUDIX hydrolase [Spirochaetota bacterium]MCX8096230.1 NUDIX hydrolase [Spirochaetota bacterium]MDW8112946.1 NUDIX hydrolase [Spirochaetia bacterium]
MNKFEIVENKLIYKGRAFSLFSDKIKYDNKIMIKDVVDYPNAVAVIPMIEKNKFVLIKQFRYPVKEELLEVPAGKIEKGEDVIEGARRELEEETGYRAERLEKIYEYYPAVGYSTEKIHIVLATNLTLHQKNLDEDEFTEVVILDYDEIIRMIKDNQIKDAKTIICFSILGNRMVKYEV